MKHPGQGIILLILTVCFIMGAVAIFAEENMDTQDVTEWNLHSATATDLREIDDFFTITFVFNDGTDQTETVRVIKGVNTTAPEDPTRDGFLFLGWFNDPVVGREFLFGDPLNMDRTLYAHWGANDWKISQWYKQLIRGGSNIQYNEGSKTLTFGEGELILTKHDGSWFNGTQLATGYYLGFRIDAPTSIKDDGDIYRIYYNGKWNDYNGPDGICSGTDIRTGCQYLNIYEPITIEEIMDLADQNVLAGNSESSGQGTRRGATHILKTLEYPIALAGHEDEPFTTLKVTLDPRYVMFIIGTNTDFSIRNYYFRFSITFDLNGGTGEGDYNKQICVFGEQATKPKDPKKPGYAFEGWYSCWDEEGEIKYSDWPFVFDDPLGVRAGTKLRAKWKEIGSFTATYMKEENTAPYGIYTVAYSDTIPQPDDPSKEGHTFNGWNPEIPSEMPAENLLFTAVWNANTYSITWIDGNGETLKTEQVAFGTMPVYEGDIPTKNSNAQYSYIFNGKWTPEIAKVSGAATYTAQFDETVNIYQVFFNTQGGMPVPKTQIAVWGNTATEPETDPELDDYVFKYWTATAPGQDGEYDEDPEEFDFNTTAIEADTTLYAYWTPVEEEPTVIFRSYNLMFEGIIQLRIRYIFPEELLALENPGNVVFYRGEEVYKTIPIKDGTEFTDSLAYFLDVPIKMYADIFSVQVLDAEGNPYRCIDIAGENDYTEGREVSVETYCDAVLAGDYGEAIENLVIALKDYGIASKIQFQYSDYATLTVDARVSSLTANDMEKVAKTEGTLPVGVTSTQNVDFEASNNMRAIYALPAGKTAENYTFTGPDPVLRGDGRYQQAVNNIFAKNLGDDLVFVITDGTNTFTRTTSPAAYCRAIVESGVGNDMKNLAKAMYLYWKAAKAYYGN